MASVRTVTEKFTPSVKAIEVPVELQFLLSRLKKLWQPLRYPAAIQSKKDLKDLTEKAGIKHRLQERDLYEKNTSMVLDYIVANFLDDFMNIFTKTDDLKKAVKNIFEKLKDEGILAVESYFDEVSNAPHVFNRTEVSANLYIKIFLFKEFLIRFKEFTEKAVLENARDKNSGITPFAKAAVDIFVLGDINAQAMNILYENSKIIWGYIKIFGTRQRLSGMINNLETYNANPAHKVFAQLKFKEYLKKNFDTEDSRVFSAATMDKLEISTLSPRFSVSVSPQPEISVSSHHATLYGSSAFSNRKNSGSSNAMKAESLNPTDNLDAERDLTLDDVLADSCAYNTPH